MRHPGTGAARRALEAGKLLAATILVLGTASLLFFLTFRERHYDVQGRAMPLHDHLLDIAVLDGRLWAVGHGGRILRSDDRGGRWSFPESGVETPLSGVAFRDESTGLAVGYDGVILRTTDGGRKWTRVPSGVDVYLTTVRFVSGERAFAAGEWGTILSSDDAGSSWHATTDGAHDFIINDLAFAADGTGWAVGELGQALRTTDGGKTWTHRRVVEDETTLFTVSATSEAEVWVAGADSLLLRSRDGGSSWERVAAPCPPTQLLRLRFAGARGYAVGRRCVAVTGDGGDTWRRSRLAGSVRYSWLYGLHVTADEVWVAGYGEALFRAGADDGSWEELTVARRGDGNGSFPGTASRVAEESAFRRGAREERG